MSETDNRVEDSLLLLHDGSEVRAWAVTALPRDFEFGGVRYVDFGVYPGDFGWLHGARGIVGVFLPFAADFYPAIRVTRFIREAKNVVIGTEDGGVGIHLENQESTCGDEFWIGAVLYVSENGEVAIGIPRVADILSPGERIVFPVFPAAGLGSGPGFG